MPNWTCNKEMLNDEALFKKLKNNIAARSKLSSIHAARAYKYGHVQFGPKSWYKESNNISEKLTLIAPSEVNLFLKKT